MTLYDKKREALIKNLKNKEYRDAFVEAYLNETIPFQIRAIRKQRRWTQKQLGDHARMVQPRISVLEDANDEKTPNISTLCDIASAFDVALIFRFVPISDLVKWKLNLSEESLQVLSFEEDPYFQTTDGDVDNAADRIKYTGETQQEASGSVVFIKAGRVVHPQAVPVPVAVHA